MSPRLEEITPRNLDAAIGIRVRPEQEYAVAPVAQSLAEAYAHPAGVAWPRLIVDDGRPVGFLTAFFDIDWHRDGSLYRSVLWRLNVSADAQGRGYGRFAVESVAAELRRRGAGEMYVSRHPGPDGPEAFHLGLGFCPTEEMDTGERVGALEL
ncbi:GNAT family N-acetyltransferase [Streptomyces broussonetiae]|uniref:GNAT family N-acetyltransferase n=1 Tax=Streptomyces broussonetiae TaxID=2686304 RepID=UPI0035DD3BD6